ncbi:MAG: alpha-L-fucosidase [Prevotella sp.]
MKKAFLFILLVLPLCMQADNGTLHQLQQAFVDLRFGMFIHYNIPTYAPEDWPDPDLSPEVFNPQHLDCRQWAKAAKSAHMTYGCLTTKHHSGFCIWDTKTTDYNVMNSPLKRDVVREYADAFRKEGLKVMLYYSILDTHHRLRPHLITREKIDMIKAQLHELLTGYGPITALIIDGWDAPWSRISYDEVPFDEIYHYIKSIQPNCLVMDLNAAKYPREALFYTDIKSYEQGAGQRISTNENKLPALACLPLQKNWFWKASFPTDELKSASDMVNKNIIPYGKAYCNFILNVAPNRDGQFDSNAIQRLKEIGELWNNDGHVANLPSCESPIIGKNVAKNKPSESSWSYDYGIMDFANDDDFVTAWISHPLVEQPFWEVDLLEPCKIDKVVITEEKGGVIRDYMVEYRSNKEWKTLFAGAALTDSRVKIHDFTPVTADGVRITVRKHQGVVKLAEVGVYKSEAQ